MIDRTTIRSNNVFKESPLKSKFILFLSFCLLSSVSNSFADEPTKPKKPSTHEIQTGISDDERPSYLQSISVTIHAASAQGSGVIKTRGDTNFVWTAGHVVSSLRSTRIVVDPKTGATKTVVEFKDARVVAELIEDGLSAGLKALGKFDIFLVLDFSHIFIGLTFE